MRIHVTALLALAACNDRVSDEDDAERAFVGLEGAVDQALTLGLAGFNASSSANIPEQAGVGEVSGTITVGGQVDQGASDNKGLRLDVSLVEYADAAEVWYDTASPLAVDLQLRDVPSGTLAGTVAGAVTMSGELDGDVTLDLDLAGDLEDDGAGGVRRVAGSTAVTGTATSAYGTYDVDLVR